MKKMVSIVLTTMYILTCCIGAAGIIVNTSANEINFTLYASDAAGVIDPATGTYGQHGAVSGAPKNLVGGEVVNGDNGTALIDIITANTLEASGTGACYGTKSIKLNYSCLNNSVTYIPSEALVAGYETEVVYNAVVGNRNYNSEVSATVTYNGGQTDTKVVVQTKEYTSSQSNGQIVPKVVGKYPNVESVKIYVSNGGGITFLHAAQFTVDLTAPVGGTDPEPMDPFMLYASDPAGVADPATGVINKNGTVSGAPKNLIGGANVNGANGTAVIDIETAGTFDASGSGPCWGKNAVKFAGNCLGNSVTYIPAEGSLNGRNTTVKYYAEVANVNANAEISALVTYNGGQTDNVVVVAWKEYTTANGNVNGQVIEKTVGTYPNVESVKIYVSYGSSYVFIYATEFIPENGTATPSPTQTPTPTQTASPTPVPTPTQTPGGAYPYYVYDTMDNAAAIYEKSGNISFYNESVKTDTYRNDPYVSYMARRLDSNRNEAYVTYRLDSNPIDTITVDAYYYDNRGYAGGAQQGTSEERLDAVLAKEGVLFYQSNNNSNYTQITNVTLIKELSPWPGITSHHVTYKITGVTGSYFKIRYPALDSGVTLYPWSARVDNIEFKYSSGGTSETYYEWVDATAYPVNRISVVTPEYTANITGATEIVVCAPGFRQLTATTWKQGTGYGTRATIATFNLDSRGVGGFVFPASQYPHGPANIKITGTSGTLFDECNLQLYNKAGVSWNEGAASAPVPPQISGLGLSQVYLDDFVNPDISIHWNDSTKKYSSHKPGWGDFSGIPFRDYDHVNNPFSQQDTYVRIRADQNLNSTGLLSSVHQNWEGFGVKAPAYFECRFMAQNAKGTWPAFWTLTNKGKSNFSNGESDELDVIEAYGFDSTQPQFSTLNGYTIARHNWNQTPNNDAHQKVNMKQIGCSGMWDEGFHVYGMLITQTDTVYYCDNVEVWRHATLPVSKVDYHFFLVNFAVGGSSGWPYDLTRYGGKADMYIDWVRVYGLPQNVQ